MRKGLCWLAALLTLWTAARTEVLIGETPPEDWPEREVLRVTVLETGRSDAILLECGGEAMMIDGGEEHYCLSIPGRRRAAPFGLFLKIDLQKNRFRP